MLDRTLTFRLSRRSALQLLSAGAAAALVPLGSIAAAQSSSPAGNDAQPSPQPGNGSRSGSRFSPAPSPQPSPTPELAGNPSTTTTAPATASGPAAEKPEQTTTAAAPISGGSWVQNYRATELWSGPDEKAISFGWAPVFSYFKVMSAQDGPRIRVQNPLTNGVAFVTARDVGPSGAPPEWYLTQKSQLAIPARIVGGANIRRTPAVEDGNIVGHAGHNEGIGVIGEVKGSDGEVWYRIGPNEM